MRCLAASMLLAGALAVSAQPIADAEPSRRRAVGVGSPARVEFRAQLLRLDGLDGEVAVEISMKANFVSVGVSTLFVDGVPYAFRPAEMITTPSGDRWTLYRGRAHWTEEVGFFTTGDHTLQIETPGADGMPIRSAVFVVPVWPVFVVYGICEDTGASTIRIRFQARYFEYEPPASVPVFAAGVYLGRATLAEAFKDNISPVRFGNYDFHILSSDFITAMVTPSREGPILSVLGSEDGVPQAEMRYAYATGKDFYPDCGAYPGSSRLSGSPTDSVGDGPFSRSMKDVDRSR